MYGALVGGPSKNDTFEDDRKDFAATEVTLDWNAALAGLMAGLSGERITWDNCKAAGLQDKPGDVGQALSSGSRQPGGSSLLLLGSAAVALFLACLL